MKKIIIVFVFIFCFLGYQVFGQIDETQIFKLSQVINNIGNFYTDSIDDNKLIEQTIISTLKELDPHSNYFTKEELVELQKGLKGRFYGIGITYNILRDTILILSTVHNSPADKIGIKAGDRIIKIENVNVAGTGITTKNVGKLFLGKKGDDININVKRQGISNLLDFTIVRDKIPIHSIDAAYMINNDLAYIKLNRFSATSFKEFNDAAKKLKKQGAKHLIFDLRNNGGGYLHIAIKIVDSFLKKNKMIVYTEGNKSKLSKYTSTSSGKFKKGRLIVLINENSASASEIVSGAIQDLDRGLIIGRRSFGKGLVQRPFYLVDGSMMRLTVARYYTPSGRCIQKPYSKGKKEYKKDILVRLEKGELMYKDSINFPDSLKYYTLNKDRLVYGGGGIMPDIFVALDTSIFTEFYKKSLDKNNVNLFIYSYVDKNRQYLNSVYSDFEKFYKNFKVDDKMLNAFIDFAKNDTEIIKSEVLAELKKNQHIKNKFKALIANSLWDINEYYKINNEDSDIFLKAVEVINDKQKYLTMFKRKQLTMKN